LLGNVSNYRAPRPAHDVRAANQVQILFEHRRAGQAGVLEWVVEHCHIDGSQNDTFREDRVQAFGDCQMYQRVRRLGKYLRRPGVDLGKSVPEFGCVDAQVGQIIEPLLDALEIAYPIVVCDLKGARTDLVDRLPPERGHAKRILGLWMMRYARSNAALTTVKRAPTSATVLMKVVQVRFH
jgi:hypothetical protein